MQTVQLKTTELDIAAQLLNGGEVVAFPTETVYGLGANALDSLAVAKIFQAKGRPADNPLIVHVANVAQLESLVTHITDLERELIARFWPGPLTLVLPSKPNVIAQQVTAGLNTVAVRQPANDLAQQLLTLCQFPLAAPSANRSGKPSPTRAEHVVDDLVGRIAAVIDGGETEHGIESTVIQCIEQQVHILRPGSVTAADLQAVVGVNGVVEPQSDTMEGNAPRSPGIKYLHYAPNGTLTLVKGDNRVEVRNWMAIRLAEAANNGHRTGLLTYDEHLFQDLADVVLSMGSYDQPAKNAQRLYHCLREFDRQGVTYILAEACSLAGVGTAVMNRLRKAATEQIVTL